MTDYIELYADRELNNPLPKVFIDNKTYWRLSFGKIDAGQTKTFEIFVENQSLGTIENLEISGHTVSKPGINVTLYRNKVRELKMSGIHSFYVEWSVAEASMVKAGKATLDLLITGEITEEL